MTRFPIGVAGAAALALVAACAPQARPAVPQPQPFSPQGEPIARASYRCDSGKRTVASYYSGGVQLEYGGETYTLPQVVAASGARYADEAFEWWTKGPAASVGNPATSVFYDTCRELGASADGDAAPSGQPDPLNARYLVGGAVVTVREGRGGPGDGASLEVVASALGKLDLFSADLFSADTQEAAVVLRQRAPGASDRYYLSVLTTDPDRLIDALELGEDLEIESITVDDYGAIELRYRDPEPRTERYLLEGERLVALRNLGK